jgi:hypothetical protein
LVLKPGVAQRTGLWLLLLAAGAVCLWPALRPVHVEGFSASIVALGLHLSQGTVRDFAPFAPFNADYFGLTKLGAVYGVAALSPAFDGDVAAWVEMWIGAALTLVASADLIRRWSGAGWLTAGAALLLMTGVTESFYFINDNVPASGLLLVALALWSRQASWLMALTCGALVGLAVTIRTDAALVAAAAMPLIALDQHRLARAALLTTASGLAALAVLVVAFAGVHATPLDALRVGTLATGLWGRSASPAHLMMLVLYFLGPPALMLAAIGGAGFARQRRWMPLALALGAPLAVNLVLCGKVWEIRQLLPLAPFLGALVAKGVELTVADLRSGRRAGPAVIGATALVWLLSPAAATTFADGPRTLMGRLADLRLWSAWQGSVRDDVRTIDNVVASAPPKLRLAVLTDGWDEDRYLHLELVREGFRRVPLPAPCSAIGEAMSGHGRTVVELSLQQTFLPSAGALYADRLERYGAPCLAEIGGAREILLARAERLDDIFGKADRERGLDPNLARLTSGGIVALPIGRSSIAELDRAYRGQAAAAGRSISAEQAMALTASQTAFSR